MCSAAEMTVDSGALATMIPRRVAASTSTLSTPTPARPITFRRSALSISSFVSFVAERTTMPSYDADDRFEVGVVVDVDVEVLAQQVDAGVRDPFANENARAQTLRDCSYASKARVVATPRSISAPSSVSASSTAASAVAMSKTSK